MKTFASVYIGTYEIVLKVFEITKSKGVKEIDCMRSFCEISRDITHLGQVSFSTLDNMISVLKDMKTSIKTYRCDAYRVCAGYTLQKASNLYFVLDQIRLEAGLHVEILTNSEQRFITYIALAAQPNFEEIVSESALLVDIGGSSLQLTLFEEGEIITTEHILLGANSVRESLLRIKDKKDANTQVTEMIKKEVGTFSNIYLKDMKPKYLILINNQIHNVASRMPLAGKDHIISTEAYAKTINKIKKKQIYSVISESLEFETDDEMLMPFILLYQSIIESIPSGNIMIPGVSISDGFAYEYAYQTKMLKASHDFDRDILSAAWAMARRYGSYMPHLKALDAFSMQIFDTLKKPHKLTGRDRLLLQVICILHDCGKYISLSSASECAYAIIMSSEILGLSHSERLLIANVCACHRREEPYTFEQMKDEFSEEEYVRYLKFLAILRISNAMDNSHKQKLKKITTSLRDNQLIISVLATDSVTLEKGTFAQKADFFESVFHIRPIIREKRK
ncbi:MAG: hypothetical protein K5853_04275 [Lachnospiraceae bacterium]|nr:hypothetical protein [Lachnospiraceae bacterium]